MSTRQFTRYLDGYYGSPVRISRTPREYPFAALGDTTTARYVATYLVDQAAFTPTARGTVDPENAGFYLESETKPEIVNGDIAQFSRTYSSVPADVVSYSTRVITKPTAASAGGTTGAVYIFYASPAGTGLGLYTSYQGYLFAPNNKIYGPLLTATSANNGGNTRLTATAHGIAGTESIIVAGIGGSTARYGIVAPGAYTVVDANTIDVLGYNLGTAAISLAKYLRDYTPGTDRVGLRRTQKFYLPGVTGGITTPADIPLPSLLVNDIELLASLLANLTGYQTYDASELTRWNDGPIYTQTYDEIDMATL